MALYPECDGAVNQIHGRFSAGNRYYRRCDVDGPVSYRTSDDGYEALFSVSGFLRYLKAK